MILILRAFSLLLYLIVRLATLVSLAFGRAAEYKADAFAGNLGFAPDLIDALLVMEGVDESYLSDADARFNSINDTHPPTAKRIERLRQISGRQEPT